MWKAALTIGRAGAKIVIPRIVSSLTGKKKRRKRSKLWTWSLIALAGFLGLLAVPFVMLTMVFAIMASAGAMTFSGGTLVQATGTNFLCPVPHPVITQRFGPTDVLGEPLVNGHPFHMGIDMAVPQGIPIVAATSGIVDFAGDETDSLGNLMGYGHYVRIKDAYGNVEFYGHMSVREVITGQTVQAGQEIGKVGSTGFSSGPHLHFEWRVNGKAQDPGPNLPTGCK